MKRAAVLGHPISHSLSPKLHGYWLKKYQIDGLYEAIDTPPEILSERLSQLMSEGYKGVNLTVPLKELAMPLMDELTETACQIGAVNTVTFHQGKFCGDNTDAYGFIANLEQHVSNISNYLNHAVIIGAGGAARAVIAGLLVRGVKRITLTNRTLNKAEKLAEMSSVIEVVEWEKRNEYLSDATLLINTTSLGMDKQPPLSLSIETLPPNALVTDIVYHPLQTDLLKESIKRDNNIVTGIGMLIHQAVPAFKAFYGQKVELDEQLTKILLS